jgi:hypothetical protein
VAYRRGGQSLRPTIVVALSAAIAGCAAPPPPTPQNALVGTWANAEDDSITIRPDTVVQNQPDGQPVPLDSEVCDGRFSFGYATRSRAALTALLPRQPGLAKSLSELLVAPAYPVAVLHCADGDQTYVLLSGHQLVAIYRDGDIGAIERLVRQ